MSQVYDTSICCRRRKNPLYIFFSLYCLPQFCFDKLSSSVSNICLFLHSQFLLQLCHHGHVFPQITLPVQKSVSYVLFFCRQLWIFEWYPKASLNFRPTLWTAATFPLHFRPSSPLLARWEEFVENKQLPLGTVLASKNLRQPSSKKVSKIISFICWFLSFWLHSLKCFLFLLTKVP